MSTATAPPQATIFWRDIKILVNTAEMMAATLAFIQTSPDHSFVKAKQNSTALVDNHHTDSDGTKCSTNTDSTSTSKKVLAATTVVNNETVCSRIVPETSGRKSKPTNVGPATCKSDWTALERVHNNGGGAATGVASKYSTGARSEAERKLITNRAAVRSDVCNPERKTMHNQTPRDQGPNHAADVSVAAGRAVLNDTCNPARKTERKIIEVGPAHLSVDVENGKREKFKTFQCVPGAFDF